jgi:transposase
MTMLADHVEVVIGVDTHKHTHTEAVVMSATGAAVGELTVPTDPDGYLALLDLAEGHPGLRAWAIEGTGGYGAGLTRFLIESGERVIELDRPQRSHRRGGAKSDPIDAVRAARDALSRDHQAEPRARGERAALDLRRGGPHTPSGHFTRARRRPRAQAPPTLRTIRRRAPKAGPPA